MAAFRADTEQLKHLLDTWGNDLFALCYLETGGTRRAMALMTDVLCDMAAGEKLWNLAQQGREGFLRVAVLNCTDDSLRRPKRVKRKKGEIPEPRFSFPFTLTEPLRAILKLRLPHKAALFSRDRLQLPPEEGARLLGVSPARWQRLCAGAEKKAKVTRVQSQAALASLAPGEGVVEQVWEDFLQQQGQRGFSLRQRYRRLHRAMDTAVPLLALGVVAVCVVAFLGVERGWFGTANVPSQQIASQGESSSADLPLEVGDVSVYVPEEDGFAAYIVHNTPQDLEKVVRQMVYLGGAPAGTTLLSASLDNHGAASSEGSVATYTLGDTLSLTVELSEEAAALSGEEGERMLQAMAATFAGFYEDLDELFLRCGGEELTINGQTAQDFLGQELNVTRTVDTDYRG